MQKKVLVLTHREDRHADAIIEELNRRATPSFRINTEEIIDQYSISFNSRSSLFTLSEGNRTETIDETWSIWNRRVSDPSLPASMPRDLKQIVYEETSRTWQGLIASARGRVVNRLDAEKAANNKINNLLFAKRFGIRVPETTVTNDPSEVIDFYSSLNVSGRKICHKLQKVAIVEKNGEDLVTYTNIVDDEALKDAHLVRSHPNMFQEYINKLYEVRVTALEDLALGIAIHSQDSELSQIDYRRYDFENVRYEKIGLPSFIEEFTLKILKHYGLFFGALDFVIDKDEVYHFLELNPNGQWLWLEKMSGFNITTHVADNLLK